MIADRLPELGIFVDLDPGFGRSGVPLGETERAMAVAVACSASLRGLHSYEGHIVALPMAERPALADRIHRQLASLADRIDAMRPVAAEASPLELITSGTPSFLYAVDHPAFTGRFHRVSPGTVVYSDLMTEALGLGYEFAAKVCARVISRPSAERATLDAGSKAVDAAAGDPCARVEGWVHLEAKRPSEEHLPLVAKVGAARSDMPRLGALLTLIPNHVCPTINLADEAVLVEGGKVVGVVDVVARGHEVVGVER
jgi:D-serine deaminase-like pyridoxal phosphate-dependent protein